MFYITIQPYSNCEAKPQRVDESKILSHLKNVVLLQPHRLVILSQERTGTDHHRVVSTNEDLIYSYERHGFVVDYDTVQHVSRSLHS